MRKNLQQRKAELERQKISIMGKEKALKETERRERTKKLIEMGGLISKAGIDTLDTNALYGALLSIKEKNKQGRDPRGVESKRRQCLCKGRKRRGRGAACCSV